MSEGLKAAESTGAVLDDSDDSVEAFRDLEARTSA